MNAIFHIFRKEITDAMRDRRTLAMVLLSSLLILPIMLLVISEIVSQSETQEEKRRVLAANIEQAPSLENFILRQGYQIEKAPEGYEEKLRNKEVTQPVLLISENFEDTLSQGKKGTLEIVYDTSNKQAEFGLRPLKRILGAYADERSALNLSMRGVSAEILQTVEIKERHLSRPNERKVTLTAFLPLVMIMAIVVGGMFAAIDTTAGERERGSLEPLMMNPMSGWQMVVGKWGAVMTVCVLVVVLTVLSFFPSQWLIRSDALRAEFQFGVKDALKFLIVLLPLAASLSAMQVAISLTCKSFKEAQVRNQMFSLVVTMVPFMLTVNPGKEPKWFEWTPVLAQNLMMNQVLKGEVVGIVPIAIAFGVCIAITIASLAYVAKRLRSVVIA